MEEDEEEFWLVRDDGDVDIWIGPFAGPDAEEYTHNFRLMRIPNEGFYITRQKPPVVMPPHAVDYIKQNLL